MKTTTLKELLSQGNSYDIQRILIPKIQRSYAQGRQDAHATKTRTRFLTAIREALKVQKPLTLDFIYGNVTDGCLVPLDGQQRLTTLWLLHWFARELEKHDFPGLERFSYDTRYSARDFLKRLVDFRPDFSKGLSVQIHNQGWFPMDWNNDPTVAGMLVMLDEIQNNFADIEGLWEKLDLINFYFLSISEMNLTDEIYIKMNSRGKPLTDFEHFKAEFLKTVRSSYHTAEEGEKAGRRIGLKIDTEWTDLLWPYRNSDNIVDEAFMRYFLLVTHIITYREGQSVTGIRDLDHFGLLNLIYKDRPDHIEYFETTLDEWVRIQKEWREKEPESVFPLDDFFADYLVVAKEYLSDIYNENVVVTLDNMSKRIFGECVEKYPFVRMRPNNLQWMIVFYTFLTYIMKGRDVKDDEFRRRLRIVVNLQKNSSNEVVDTPNADAGNRMPAILKQIEGIILRGEVDTALEIDGEKALNFSVAQLTEERDKLIFTTENPGFAPRLFALEDHPVLTGCTQVVGYENTGLYQRFMRLFDMEIFRRDAVDRALLSLGDYSQRKNTLVIALGSGNEDTIRDNAWHALFHPTEKTAGFGNTKVILHRLLNLINETSEESALIEVIEDYQSWCAQQNQYDWKYYYIKYSAFRPFRYGKYAVVEGLPYEMVALWASQKESTKSYQCFLGEIEESKLCKEAGEWLNSRTIEYGEGLLTCRDDRFEFLDADTGAALKFLPIPRNEEGIDTVDRLLYISEHHDASEWEDYRQEIEFEEEAGL